MQLPAVSMPDLPAGFSYPVQYLRFQELEIREFDPWNMLEGNMLALRYRGLIDHYPSSRLVPFAARYDRDDIACFDVERGLGSVVNIHDFASPGFERREEYDSFREWLHAAIDTALDF